MRVCVLLEEGLLLLRAENQREEKTIAAILSILSLGDSADSPLRRRADLPPRFLPGGSIQKQTTTFFPPLSVFCLANSHSVLPPRSKPRYQRRLSGVFFHQQWPLVLVFPAGYSPHAHTDRSKCATQVLIKNMHTCAAEWNRLFILLVLRPGDSYKHSTWV